MPAPQEPPPTPRKPALLDMAAYIAAPGTVAVGLLYYVGSTYTQEYYSTLGVPADDLQLSYQSMAAKATGPIFFPLWCLLAVGLVTLLTLAWLGRRLAAPEHAALRRGMSRWLFVTGVVMAVLGFPVFWAHLLSPLPGGRWLDFLSPLIVAGGATLAIFAIQLHLARSGTPRAGQSPGGERLWLVTGAVLIGLLTMSLFLQTTQYTVAAGRDKAIREAEGGYRHSLSVVLHSRVRLAHNASQITVEDKGSGSGPYRYQYIGFRILAKAPKRFYLVSWASHYTDRIVVVLPDDGNVWVELRGEQAATLR
ncbi:hypothetical protein [Streptomyces sp. NPDC054834]